MYCGIHAHLDKFSEAIGDALISTASAISSNRREVSLSSRCLIHISVLHIVNETKLGDPLIGPGRTGPGGLSSRGGSLNVSSQLLSSFARWVWANLLLPSLSEAFSALLKAIASRLSAWATSRLVAGGAA